MNIPNALSFLRIILIPVFVYFFLVGDLLASAITLVVSGTSDLLDGYFARKFNQITELGKILDPIADKLTLGAVVICMWIIYATKIPWLNICFAIIIVKDFIMAVGTLVLVSKGARPTAAKWYGKISTAFFYCAMLVLVMFEVFAIDFAWKTATINILVSLTAVLAVFALIGYTHTAIRLLKEKKQS